MMADESELARTFIIRLNKLNWTRLRVCEKTGLPIVLVFAPRSKVFGENASTTIYVKVSPHKEGDSPDNELV